MALLTIFRSRLDPAQADEYAVWAARIDALAHAAPGFVAIKTFAAADGERVSIVEFADAETQRAWLHQPEHREAQRLGREKFYLEYRIYVCEVIRSTAFRREDRWELWRQDDNGTRQPIARFASREEAQRACDEFEARGHKQLYWIEER